MIFYKNHFFARTPKRKENTVTPVISIMRYQHTLGICVLNMSTDELCAIIGTKRVQAA